MSTSAIVMMIVSIVIIWGGLLLSLLRLPNEKAFRALKMPSEPLQTAF